VTRWYLNQTVSLCEFGTVERSFSLACQTNCFQGEALAAYDPCGNMISLVTQSTGVEAWARAIDKNSDSTIGIYNPYAMEIPFSAQATIHPSYDQPINGPIEFHIPEQGQLDLKELLANMTRVNTTVKENGVDASSSGDDDCGEEPCISPDDKEYAKCVQRCFNANKEECGKGNRDPATLKDEDLDKQTSDSSNDVEAKDTWDTWNDMKDEFGGDDIGIRFLMYLFRANDEWEDLIDTLGGWVDKNFSVFDPVNPLVSPSKSKFWITYNNLLALENKCRDYCLQKKLSNKS